MESIFLSYRRSDSEGQAGRLFQNLVDHFGRGAVLLDVAGLEKGRDFRKSIDTRLGTCKVMLAMIGRGWVNARDDAGARRLDSVGDLVRTEIAAALRRDIPVIPVLVGGATMPHESDLPDDLKDLVFRDGVELTHARWDSDVALLVAALTPYLVDSAPASPADVPTAVTPAPRPASAAPPVAASPSAPARRLPLWLAGLLVLGSGGGWMVYQQRAERATRDALAAQVQAERDRAAQAAALQAQQQQAADEKLAVERAARDQAVADAASAKKALAEQAEQAAGREAAARAAAAREAATLEAATRAAAAREAAARDTAAREVAARDAAARDAAARDAAARASAASAAAAAGGGAAAPEPRVKRAVPNAVTPTAQTTQTTQTADRVTQLQRIAAGDTGVDFGVAWEATDHAPALPAIRVCLRYQSGVGAGNWCASRSIRPGAGRMVVQMKYSDAVAAAMRSLRSATVDGCVVSVSPGDTANARPVIAGSCMSMPW